MAIQLLIMSAPMIVDIDLTLDLSILTARELVVKNDRWEDHKLITERILIEI